MFGEVLTDLLPHQPGQPQQPQSGPLVHEVVDRIPPDRPLLASTVRALPAGLVLLLMTRVLPRGIWWVRATVLGVLNIGACVLAAAGVSLLVLKPQAELDGVGALAGLLGAAGVVGAVVLAQRGTGAPPGTPPPAASPAEGGRHGDDEEHEHEHGRHDAVSGLRVHPSSLTAPPTGPAPRPVPPSGPGKP